MLLNWVRDQLRPVYTWAYGSLSDGPLHLLTTVAVGLGETWFQTCCHVTRNWLIWTRQFVFIVLKLNGSLSDSSTCVKCLIKHWEDCQYRSTSKSLNNLILHNPSGEGLLRSDFSQVVQACVSCQEQWSLPCGTCNQAGGQCLGGEVELDERLTTH